MTEDDPLIEDTGLVTAAATMHAEPPPEPDPVMATAAAELVVAPAVAMPDGWTLQKVASLVGDVAQNMYELPYLLKKHALTEEQYAYLQQNIFFQRALEADIITWNGANSIQKRLALQAAIAVENAMPTVAARLSKPTEPLSDVVALLKILSEIAGTIGAKAVAQTPTNTEKFKIIINMGGDVTEREATVLAPSVRPQPEGLSATETLQALVAAPRMPA